MDHQPDSLIVEVNHRAANTLAMLGSVVRLQARAVGKTDRSYSHTEVQMMFDGIAARIATIGQLYRLMASLPLDGAIPLERHLREICSALTSAFSSAERPLKINLPANECLVLTQHVQPLTLIICEVLINAMKYAHPSADVALVINITCHSQTGGTLAVSIADDGVGLPEGFDPQKDGGVGFQLIRALTTEMGGAMNVHSDNLGTTLEFTIPQALVANARSA